MDNNRCRKYFGDFHTLNSRRKRKAAMQRVEERNNPFYNEFEAVCAYWNSVIAAWTEHVKARNGAGEKK